MQSLLFVSVLLAAITVGGLVFKYRRALDFSISLNAAKHPLTIVWLAAGIGASLLAACGWYIGWFASVYDTSYVSNICFGLIVMCLLIAIVIPDIKGWRRNVHRLAGYIAVLAMPVFLASVFAQLNDISRLVATTVITAQVVMIYLLFFVKSALKYLLQFQALYIGCFFLVLLLITYA